MPKQTSFYRDVHCFYEGRGGGGAHPYHKTCKRGGRGLKVRQSSFKFVERGLLGVGSMVWTILVYLIFIYHLICLFSRCPYKILWAELGGMLTEFFKYIFRKHEKKRQLTLKGTVACLVYGSDSLSVYPPSFISQGCLNKRTRKDKKSKIC